jgi:hypothetical protein
MWTEATLAGAIPSVIGGLGVIRKRWPNLLAMPQLGRKKKKKRLIKRFSKLFPQELIARP